MKIDMIETVGECAKGGAYEVDEATASKYVEAGLAKPYSEEPAPVAKIAAEIESRITKSIAAQLEKSRPTVPATPKQEEYKSFGEYVQCVFKVAKANDWEVKQRAANMLREKYVATKVQSETNDAGGYAVPVEYASELLRVQDLESAALWESIRKITPGTSTINFPVLDQTVTPSDGSNAFTGGMSVAFASEGAAPAGESNVKFKQLNFAVKKLTAYTEITDELLEDANVNMASEIKNLFREEIGSYLSWQVLNGSASGANFTGLVDHASVISVARDKAIEFKLPDAARMYSRFVGNDGLWVLHPYIFEYLAQTSVGNTIAWLPNLTTGKPTMALLGYRAIKCQHMPLGGAMLIDPAKYIAAVRKDITIAVSDQVRFIEGRSVFKVTLRVHGKPSIEAPIKMSDGTNYLSPFVAIGDVAS